LTMNDLGPHLNPKSGNRIPSHWPLPPHNDEVTPVVLADSEVVYAGEAIAVVVASSRYVAEDAAMLVEVEYESLAAIADCKQGIGPGAPLGDTRRKANVLSTIRQSFGDIDRAFASDAHKVAFSLKQQRGGPHPIEGRGLVASYEPIEDRLTIW